MALINPPAWLQQGSYPARTDRLVIKSIVPNAGVVDGLAVVQTSGVSMGVRIGSGRAFIEGTSTTLQGMYNAVNDAFTTVPLVGSDSTFPRYDLIVLQIRDADVSGSTNEAVFLPITGTPSSNPQVPAAPSSSLVLARVLVAANASTISNAAITDTRLFTASGGGIIWVPDEAARLRLGNPTATSVYYVHQNDTQTLWMNNSSSWSAVSSPQTEITVAPTAAGVAGGVSSGAAGSFTATKINGVVHLTGTIGGRPTSYPLAFAQLPVGYRPRNNIKVVSGGSGQTNQSIRLVGIDPNGTVYWIDNTGGVNGADTGSSLYVTGISYLAA